MLEFITLVGLSGSGKTHYADAFYPSYIYISPDDIIEDVARNMGMAYEDVYNTVIDAALKICEAKITLASYAGENIILDNTNLSVEDRKRFLGCLKYIQPYKSKAIYMDTPEELIRLRNAKRGAETHISTALEIPTKEEGFDEVITIAA